MKPLLLRGAFGSLCLVAVARAEGPPPREQAQRVIEHYCGSCHSGASPDAKPAALKIFDTDKADWLQRLSETRLHRVVGRLPSFGVPPDEQAPVIHVVEDELRSRKH